MKKIDLEKFKKLKNKTKDYYQSVGNVYCPALRSDIIFNSDGFHHLCYDESKKERNKRVQKNKLMCFKDGERILKKSTTIQEYRRSICPVGKKNKSGLRKTSILEWFGFFSIISFSRGIRVKVIVRRIGGKNGQYHFWSVMPYWSLSNKNRIIGSKSIEDK